MLLNHLFDLADSLLSQLVNVFSSAQLLTHSSVLRGKCFHFNPVQAMLYLPGSVRATQTHTINSFRCFHREITHRSNVSHSKQMTETFHLDDWLKRL